LPGSAVSFASCSVVPEIFGCEVLAGGAPTGPVPALLAVALPVASVAVTVTLMVLPASAAESLSVLPVAPFDHA
jgi:hypothetical protein